MRAGGLAALLAAVAAAGGVRAQGQAADRALAPLIACRATPDPVQRAGCYDRALDQVRQAAASRQVVIVDREQVTQDRRAGFGYNAGRVPPPPRPPKEARAARAAPEEIAEINSTVASASQAGYDRWTVRLATGAVWRTTEGGLVTAPRPGMPVRIRRSLMGSYMLRVGGRTVRAMRVG